MAFVNGSLPSGLVIKNNYLSNRTGNLLVKYFAPVWQSFQEGVASSIGERKTKVGFCFSVKKERERDTLFKVSFLWASKATSTADESKVLKSKIARKMKSSSRRCFEAQNFVP